MPKPKTDKSPEDSAKDAAEDAGKPGDFVVKGMKKLGEIPDKLQHAPKVAADEVKKVPGKLVGKGKKLLGLSGGGTLAAVATKPDPLTWSMNMANQRELRDGGPGTFAAPAPSGGGGNVATKSSTPVGGAELFTDTGTIANNPLGSGALISQGLRQSVAAGSPARKDGFLTGFAQGGFITMKGPRKGSKGVGGKRMPKKGVMA